MSFHSNLLYTYYYYTLLLHLYLDLYIYYILIYYYNECNSWVTSTNNSSGRVLYYIIFMCLNILFTYRFDSTIF